MKKKTIIKKLIIIVIILILAFFGYKAYLLHKYNVDKRDIDTNTIFQDEITINLKEYTGELFNYQNISFRNDFKDYVQNEYWYVKKDKNDEVTSAMYITKMNQYHDLLIGDNLELINDTGENVVNKVFSDNDRESFLKEYNINNDIDLLKYIKDNYYLKNNILTCSKKMKQNYIINDFVDVALPTFNKITLIKGDLTGYILYSNENIRQIHILSNNDQFIISLVGKELVTDQHIISLLETIKIN